MKKLTATLSTLTLALVSLFNCGATHAQQSLANVQGNWTIYSTSIKDGSLVIKHVQIAQYGNHITGYFEGPDQAGPIQGELKGNFIHFSTVTRTILNFHGHVYGDNIAGNYGIRGKQAPWQAVVSYGQPMLPPPTTPSAPAAAPQASSYSQPSSESQESNSYTPQTNGGDSRAEEQTQTPSPAPLSSEQLDSLVA